jgi:hypothetical protein
MKMRQLLTTGILLLFVTGLFSCSKKSSNNNTATTAQMNLHLTDDPAAYDAVYIDIQKIGVTMSGSAEVLITPYRPGVYNILSFKNGLDTLLFRNNIPTGTVQQIRLILGNNNSVVVSGTSYPLNTPSAQESGVKLNLNQTFAANGSYDIWIDFDAAKSIVQTGSGSFKLKPVVRAFSALTNGKIEGNILPVASLSTVYAINGTDTASAIPSGTDGYFVISGLASANYQLLVVPSITAYLSVSTTANVTYGQVTNVGTITLHP